MMLLAADDKPNPLGHVLDKVLVGDSDFPIITMHMLTLVLAALIALFVMWRAAESIATGSESEGNRRYVPKTVLGGLIETMIVGLRDAMILPLLGEKATRTYLPYLMTLFFFILVNNLLGLVPLLDLQHLIGAAWGDTHWAVIGGTATGNISVNIGLALIAFIVIQNHGIKENGIGGWAHHFLGGAPVYMAPIMLPVELMGMIIKPAALALRLAANMLAGHTLLAIIFVFGVITPALAQSYLASLSVTAVAAPFALFIYCLELLVALLQAFVFMFLTAVFISQLSHHDYDDHDHAGAAAF